MSAIAQFAGRRMLFLNWRDLSNPAAGGAEEYTEQIGRRFAQAGAHVTLFTSEYRGAEPYDWSHEYLVVRQGGPYGVYLAAARHLERFGHQYDAVVDFQNGIPFFAPLWAPVGLSVACVVHHVHQSQFDMYFHWPMNRVGRLLEGRVTRGVYRHAPFLAVSTSTRAEIRHQLHLGRPIHIVPNGITPLPPSQMRRARTPVIAVVTRLMPHKRLHLLVDALPALLDRWPDLSVDIAGTGSAMPGLVAQVRRLGLEQKVHLPGHVTEQVKSDLLTRAWLTVAPSIAEGWGLTVVEAAMAGTPAVAYDVPGLRDSVCDGKTGWLVPEGSELAPVLARAVAELEDPARRNAFADQAGSWASRFSWDASAERMARVLLSEIARRSLGCPARRRAIDLATVAAWPPGDEEEIIRHLHKALRVTDAFSTGQEGLRVLLTGSDEVGAASALRRAGVPRASLRPATTAQLLCGTGEDGLR